MRERLFAQCLYRLGTAWIVWLVLHDALPISDCLSKRVGAREHPLCSSSPRRRGSILGRQVPHDDGFPPPRDRRVDIRERLFVKCLYRLGNAWSVWMVPVLFAECPDCLCKRVV